MHYDGKMKIASHAPAETMVKLLPLAKKWEAEEELADNEKPQTYLMVWIWKFSRSSN